MRDTRRNMSMAPLQTSCSLPDVVTPVPLAPVDERETRLLLTFMKDATHFKVLRVMGKGSFGVVFAVLWTHPEAPYPDKEYALKVP